MPNKNYLKGVRLERKLVNRARKEGLIAFRSAGSHSIIDVVIIDTERNIIDLIQCKAGKSYTAGYKDQLIREHSKLNKEFKVRFNIEDGS